MPPIKVNVTLYGSLAKKVGAKYIAQLDVELSDGSCKDELLSKLGISHQERGYLFINSILCDVPGLVTNGGELLKDKDHVGIFSFDYMWPYQYRDGVRMSESLTEALREKGSMHHTYEQAGKIQNPDLTNPKERK